MAGAGAVVVVAATAGAGTERAGAVAAGTLDTGGEAAVVVTPAPAVAGGGVVAGAVFATACVEECVERAGPPCPRAATVPVTPAITMAMPTPATTNPRLMERMLCHLYQQTTKTGAKGPNPVTGSRSTQARCAGRRIAPASRAVSGWKRPARPARAPRYTDCRTPLRENA
jgi:hypothetical protein